MSQGKGSRSRVTNFKAYDGSPIWKKKEFILDCKKKTDITEFQKALQDNTIITIKNIRS